MGNLELSSGLPNFSKAVISVFFRVPQATVDIMKAIAYPGPPQWYGQGDGSDDGYYWPALYKTLPLIVFGSVETETYSSNRIQPSHIGISFLPDDVNALCVNLQTPVMPTYVSEVGQNGVQYRPMCYFMSGWYWNGDTNTGTHCAPEIWHHALISFDISNPQSADWDVHLHPDAPVYSTGGNVFSWALDDVCRSTDSNTLIPANRTANQNTPFSQQPAGSIISNWMLEGGWPGVHFDFSPADQSNNRGDYVNCPAGYIGNGPVAIPCSNEFISQSRKIELAHLQFYTGVYADTNDQAVRRLFIDDNGEPVDPTQAIQYFGKSPEIAFLGATDWQTGTNTGTAGNFTVNGTIKKFSPNPKLGA